LGGQISKTGGRGINQCQPLIRAKIPPSLYTSAASMKCYSSGIWQPSRRPFAPIGVL